MHVFKQRSQGIIVLGFLVIITAITAYVLSLQVNRDENQEAYSQINQDEINAQETEEIKNMTYSFFSAFKTGVPMTEKVWTDITYQYFSREFLQNTFPTEKSKLFGMYGYRKLTHTFTTIEGLQDEGGIENFEILDLQQDKTHQTITVYVRMDNSLGQNNIDWIEWRDVPSEGWKIQSMSFNGNIQALFPVSPKREF
ncbi:hypothetical protein V7068_19080 [Bacillus sp. JJ634]